MNENDKLAIGNLPIDVKSMVEDRAACGGWPKPETAGDYMAYILDEAEVQADNGEGGYALMLRSIAIVLQNTYCITPSKLPWEK